MLKGTVKFFNKAKGFGFITPDDGNKEIFLPASVVSATDAPRLKTGQRVSFEQAPDTKGPKVVALNFLEEAPRLPEAPRINITLFHAAADPASAEVVETLAEQGHQPRLVEYMAAPPPPDELKRLSLLLNGADQSLVRRYDPLFLELQLDDRFITESEFWTAVSEHPQLINGPVLMAANKVRICRSADEVRDFLGLDADVPQAKPKTLSPRIAAMMLGIEPPPSPPPAAAKPKVVAKPVAKPKPVAESPAPVPVVAAPKPARAKAVAAKPKPAADKPAAKAKKAASPAKKAAKKIAAAPAKKKAAAPAKAKTRR